MGNILVVDRESGDVIKEQVKTFDDSERGYDQVFAHLFLA